MTAGIKANVDGSAAIQVGGTDVITLTSDGAATFVTSPTTLQAGTAAAPSITFTGDPNTGIYSPGADRIGFSEGGNQVGEFDSSGNFLFNSGFGSVATAYGCRAWVNFNGSANTNLSGTYSQSGTTVTVTATAHGLIAGNSINADITTGTGVDGIYTVVSVISSSQFTYTAGTSLTTSGNVTLIRSTIRSSGNVSSVSDNGTGDYTVNFATSMPDVNYSIVGSSGGQNSTSAGAVYLYDQATARTVSFCRLLLITTTGSATDTPQINIAIFR